MKVFFLRQSHSSQAVSMVGCESNLLKCPEMVYAVFDFLDKF